MLATIKAAVRGQTLPPVNVLVFAAATFGLIAALLDWALLRDRRNIVLPVGSAPSGAAAAGVGEKATESRETPPTDPVVESARLRPIVFREICPPPVATGLSFYGGVPVGPAQLTWPRVRNKPGDAPLSFIMQWDCTELAGQDVTGLLPQNGVLYLFCDLTWGEPFDFQFIHMPGPINGSQELPVPPDLPPVYGDDGAYKVPYCSPWIAKDGQNVPCLLPKWPFSPTAFAYPASSNDALFWNDGEAVGEALLRVEHTEGVPQVTPRDEARQMPFARPFAAFPHDYAAVRVVASKVLDQLRRPASWLLREASEEQRQAKFQIWRDEAAALYASAATHSPAAGVAQSLSDDIWKWIEGLEAVLMLRWGALVEECVNVSLGLGSEAAGALPADLVGVCAENHKLASVRSLKEKRSLHAPCPNHMFGPPSFVQGHVEEHLEERVLLLELSSREPIGLEFGEGVLQFMIRPAELRDRQFDKAILVASAY